MTKTKELQAARKRLAKFEPENDGNIRNADDEEEFSV